MVNIITTHAYLSYFKDKNKRIQETQQFDDLARSIEKARKKIH